MRAKLFIRDRPTGGRVDKGNLRTLQLGIGPYENPQLDSPAIHESRILFFQLIEGFADYEDRSIEFKSDAPDRLCDDILPSFTACVFEHFRQTGLSQIRLKSLKSDADLYGHLRAKLKIQDVLDFIPNQAALKRQSDETYRLITSWAQDWNLSNSEDGWCLDFAIRVLSHWIFDPGAREFKFWNRAFKSNRSSATWDAIEVDLEKFSFEWEIGLFESSGWNPRIESIDEWRHRASDRFETTLSSLKKKGQAVPSGTKGRFKREQARYVSKIKQGLTGQQLRSAVHCLVITHASANAANKPKPLENKLTMTPSNVNHFPVF